MDASGLARGPARSGAGMTKAQLFLRNQASVLLALSRGAAGWGAILQLTDLSDSAFGRVMAHLVAERMIEVSAGPGGARRYEIAPAGLDWIFAHADEARGLGVGK